MSLCHIPQSTAAVLVDPGMQHNDTGVFVHPTKFSICRNICKTKLFGNWTTELRIADVAKVTFVIAF